VRKQLRGGGQRTATSQTGPTSLGSSQWFQCRAAQPSARPQRAGYASHLRAGFEVWHPLIDGEACARSHWIDDPPFLHPIVARVGGPTRILVADRFHPGTTDKLSEVGGKFEADKRIGRPVLRREIGIRWPVDEIGQVRLGKVTLEICGTGSCRTTASSWSRTSTANLVRFGSPR
jgi:hypothetical protein